MIANKMYDIYLLIMRIGTDIEVIVGSLTTCEVHHSPEAKLKGCGEFHSSSMKPQWPKLIYQFLF